VSTVAFWWGGGDLSSGRRLSFVRCLPIRSFQGRFGRITFLIDGRADEFRVLPFGLATSPYAFTRVVRSVVGTDAFSGGANACLPRRLVDVVVVVTDMSDKRLVCSEHDFYGWVSFPINLGEIRVGSSSDFHTSMSGIQSGGGVGSPHRGPHPQFRDIVVTTFLGERSMTV